MIKTKVYCDICEKEIEADFVATEYKIKVKKRWVDWCKCDWEKVVLYNNCRKSFYQYWKEKHDD